MKDETVGPSDGRSELLVHLCHLPQAHLFGNAFPSSPDLMLLATTKSHLVLSRCSPMPFWSFLHCGEESSAGNAVVLAVNASFILLHCYTQKRLTLWSSAVSCNRIGKSN